MEKSGGNKKTCKLINDIQISGKKEVIKLDLNARAYIKGILNKKRKNAKSKFEVVISSN